MQIAELEIKNFRGIKNFKESFYGHNLVCLIGRGDSGKSTILEAISYVLSPTWSIPINDNDFYNGDTSAPILISATITVPDDFILESKFGTHLRSYNPTDKTIHNDMPDSYIRVITIQLEIDQDLEPKWFVYKPTEEETKIPIGHKDREKLNCFVISDYLEKHFTWGIGTPLNSLARGATDINDFRTKFVSPLREALEGINSSASFDELNKTFKDNVSSSFINTENTKTQMELKDISYNVNKFSLHDGDVPYRLKGKGSKRLLSIAIQIATKNTNGFITLIDEIEQGLEPDRIRKLVANLNSSITNDNSQIFITTHSNNAIVELGGKNLFIVRNEGGNTTATALNSEYDAIVRFCPDAFFAKKIIVCEGKTEFGICRAIDEYMEQHSMHNMAYYGCVYVLGEGSNFAKRAKNLKELGYEVMILCDSDVKYTPSKNELRNLNIEICDCAENYCIEKQVFKFCSFDVINEILNYVAEDKDKTFSKLIEDIKNKNSIASSSWLPSDDNDTREYLINASLKSEGGELKSYWFKNIRNGQKIGTIILNHFETMPEENPLKRMFTQIINWSRN